MSNCGMEAMSKVYICLCLDLSTLPLAVFETESEALEWARNQCSPHGSLKLEYCQVIGFHVGDTGHFLEHLELNRARTAEVEQAKALLKPYFNPEKDCEEEWENLAQNMITTPPNLGVFESYSLRDLGFSVDENIDYRLYRKAARFHE